ncbi:MAG: alpha-E domain-containing protein, partial [Rhizobiales bacterium]|nr:alpha-E domain-containing protein [Hyphomicrobiales bacterium]
MLSRTAENIFWMARYIERAESTARLLSGSGEGDPYVNCPGDSIAGFPWLLVEGSGHQGKYIYAEVSQDELF